MSRRRKPYLSFALTFLALAGAGFLAGCPGTATTTYTPITGIEIDSTSLVAGIGCGSEPDQVFMYAAVLSYTNDGGPPGPPAFSGVFDCFSTGILSNLPSDDAGSFAFDVSIFAYNQESFPPALACGPTDVDAGSAFPLCPGDNPAVVDAVLSTPQGRPTWTTTCTAAQTSGVPQLAVCAPLVRSGASEAGSP